MKRLDESLPSLLITTADEEPSLPTRTPVSEPGSGTALRLVETDSVQGRDDAILKRLTQLTGSPPEEITRSWTGADGGFDYEITGYRIASAEAQTMLEIQAFIAEATKPAERRDIAPMLAAMAQAMPSHDQSDGEAWMECVWLAVDEFPADVILESMKKLIKREKWRPSPAEIRQECQWVGRARVALKKLEIGPCDPLARREFEEAAREMKSTEV